MSMPEEIDYSKIHTEEVDEIIGKPPPWVIRRGNIVIGSIVLILLAGGWLIRYPDTISAPVIISAGPFANSFQFGIELPVYKAARVRAGQRVLIKLREYPFEEFGMLTARVLGLARISPDKGYRIQLRLKNGLRTTRDRLLDISPEITGTADIIITDKNILQRIFE